MNDVEELLRRLDAVIVGPRAREEDVTRFEDEIGGRLPPDYREYLRGVGEARFPGGAGFTLRDAAPGGAESALRRLSGLARTPDAGLEMLTLHRFAGRIPDETIPIGDALMGDLVLLEFDGLDAGRVWLWDHEHTAGYANRMPEIRADLAARGKDPDTLDDHTAIWYWERLVPEKAPERLGFSNLYLAADSFTEFLEGLQPPSDE